MEAQRVQQRRAGNPIGGVIGVNELSVVYLFLGLLGLFVIIGALLPKYLPGLVRKLDSTVLKETKSGPSGPH